MKKMLGILMICFAMTAALSGGLLWYKYQDDQKGEAEYRKLRQEAFQAENVQYNKEGTDFTIDIQKLPVIDEKKLKEINLTYTAWLYLPGTQISYPVVYPKNNQEYLKVTFEGERRSCGSLFFDAGTEPFTSLNTIIHGHNMKSGKMFGELKKYLDEDFAKEHNKIYLFREGEWMEFRLLSVYLVSNADATPYQTMFHSQADFKDYIEKSVQKSLYYIEKDMDTAELLTLSTCHGKKEKLIVQWAEV